MKKISRFLHYYRQFRTYWGYPVIFSAREALIYARAGQ
jgi:hypothetical protein